MPEVRHEIASAEGRRDEAGAQRTVEGSERQKRDFEAAHAQAISELQRIRKKPLVVLFYPSSPVSGNMERRDVEQLYSEIRSAGWTRERPVPELDVLIHTTGGSPEAAYRMAQAIRNAAKEVTFLVPDHCYSAGTMLAFCANEIRLGDNAGLSPIDIRLHRSGDGEDSSIELLSLDYFRDFAIECRITTEMELFRYKNRHDIDEDSTTDVESKLLVEMVSQVGALDLGYLFRNRELASEYSRVLLLEYMLKGQHDADSICEKTIRGFLHRAPSHEFHMDFHLARKFGLPVHEMSTRESDAAKAVVRSLREGAKNNVICKPLRPDYSAPFIQSYVLKSSGEAPRRRGVKQKGRGEK